jgi:predicted nucleic acid-binding protein
MIRVVLDTNIYISAFLFGGKPSEILKQIDRILECAVEAQAQFIITGDKHLLTMRSFEGIPTLTADQFLKL